MLYSEQVRLLADESVKVDSGTDLTRTAVCDWTTMTTYSLVLSKEQFVYFEAVVVAGSFAYGAGQIRIDSYPIVTSGEIVNETKTIHAVVLLAAGTYSITWQLALWATGGNNIKFDSRKIGVFNFPDRSGAYESGTELIADGNTATLINANFSLPTERKLPFGVTKGCNVIINAHCYVMQERGAQMQDNEVTPGSGRTGFRIYIDDSQDAWDEVDDDYGGDTSNASYGECSFGRVCLNLSVGDTINIKIKAQNNMGSSKTANAYLRIVACVWWIGGPDFQPFTITDMPFNTTLYATMEPVWANPTKTLELGKERIGGYAGCDNYSSESGAGIVDWNYTFELISPEGAELFFSVPSILDYGTCISMIGCDMR